MSVNVVMQASTCRSGLRFLKPIHSFSSQGACQLAAPQQNQNLDLPHRLHVSLEALERSRTSLHDFCISHFMFHGLDPSNHEHNFKYLPVLAFTEAYVYEVDVEYEKALKKMQDIHDPVNDVDPFYGLKLELAARNLWTDRMANELLKGCHYLKLEQSICRSGPEDQISILDARRALEFKSADYKLLNLLLYKMRGEEVNEFHFCFLELSNLLVELADNLSDYEEDVKDNSFNIVRVFYKVYGPKLGSQMLAEYISAVKLRFEEKLNKLEPELREKFPIRYQEELSRGKSIAEIWEVPPFIDETPYSALVSSK
ncbi:uncharacterized protein LOC112343260 [Selaginella moellendorffii]|uniref:uncharacterized protein LOC112343260 n=1 Tax=Selaginella moellendorffii TaxID=88036 RepID=UPI000D1CD07C|nr:uncharacterized protein LOC112343260 [Selaginella moellendorffii]|eukprot:XP_024522182.1 uncharacterized protein LOC112343260 [Selaginella moellendorffii]